MRFTAKLKPTMNDLLCKSARVGGTRAKKDALEFSITKHPLDILSKNCLLLDKEVHYLIPAHPVEDPSLEPNVGNHTHGVGFCNCKINNIAMNRRTIPL